METAPQVNGRYVVRMIPDLKRSEARWYVYDRWDIRVVGEPVTSRAEANLRRARIEREGIPEEWQEDVSGS